MHDPLRPRGARLSLADASRAGLLDRFIEENAAMADRDAFERLLRAMAGVGAGEAERDARPPRYRPPADGSGAAPSALEEARLIAAIIRRAVG